MGTPLQPDPERDVVLDARTLRGLAHPLRVQMVQLLRHDGPSTATKLAERTGVSSAAASYHLRSLSTYGFVVSDEGPPDKHSRERWWRAAHQGTWLEEIPSDVEGAAVYGEYLRAVARAHARRTEAWIDELDSAPPVWQQVSTISDITLLLTPEEAQQLRDRVDAVVADYRRHDPAADRSDGRERVALQWQVLPELRPGP